MVDKKDNKKGQVTFFIIAGIIILIIFILVFVLSYMTTIFRPDRVVPPEMVPLDTMITDCLNTHSKDAITLIGMNGGYLNFPPEIENNPDSYISSNPIFKDIKTPLWRYRGTTRIPTEEDMQEDLEKYIEKNVKQCINLEVFESLFIIDPKNELSIDVELLSKGVSVDMNYPLEVTNRGTGQQTLLNDFRVIVPSRLKTTYELARKIMNAENNDLFVERRTVDLIAMDVDIPYTEMEFDCSPKVWKIKDVKNKLKKLMVANLPLIKIKNTNYNEFNANYTYLENHYKWNIMEEEYPSTSVSMTYDEKWPFFMFVTPNDGAMLSSYPTRGFDITSFLCMNMWHFVYDVRYPVMVTVKDKQTSDHEEYTFNFAFEVGINNNMPDTENFNTQNYQTIDGAEEEFCKETEQSLLTIRTFENISRGSYEDHIELPGVNLTFTCLKMKCPIGESEVQFRGADVFTTTEVPYCTQGLLIGEKEGYKTAKKFISTTMDSQTELFLTPIIRKEIEVVEHNTLSTGSIFTAEPLGNDSSVIITLQRDGYTSTAFYPININTTNNSDNYNSYLDIDSSEIELLAKEDFTYLVTAYLIDDQNNLLGGYKGNWTPSWSSLSESDKIRFHVLRMPFTKNEEKLVEFLMELPDNSKQISKPEMIG